MWELSVSFPAITEQALSGNCSIILKAWFCYVGAYEEVGELGHIYRVFHQKISLPFLKANKITPENPLSSLLSENKP